MLEQERERGVDDLDRTEGSGPDELERPQRLGMMEVHERLDRDPAVPLSRRGDRVDVRHGQGERLLAQDVLARVEGSDRPLGMEAVRQRDVDDVDRRISEERVERRRGRRARRAGRRTPGRGRDRDRPRRAARRAGCRRALERSAARFGPDRGSPSRAGRRAPCERSRAPPPIPPGNSGHGPQAREAQSTTLRVVQSAGYLSRRNTNPRDLCSNGAGPAQRDDPESQSELDRPPAA